MQTSTSRGPITNKTIVLDLDETLVHSSEEMQDTRYVNYKDPEVASRFYQMQLQNQYQTPMWGVTRPHTKEFLNFCFDYFDNVIVWSAGLPAYVDSIVKHIFKDVGEPDLVFARDRCVQAPNSKNLCKPLTILTDERPDLFSVPDLSSVLIVDDRTYTFESCNPHNAIHIPSFSPDPKRDKKMGADDTALVQIMDWLMTSKVRNCKDVRSLNKDTIFAEYVPISSPCRLIRPTYVPTRSEVLKLRSPLPLDFCQPSIQSTGLVQPMQLNSRLVR